MSELTSEIVKITGVISASSFVIISFGDFVTKAIDIVITRTTEKSTSKRAKKILFYWSLIKDVYEELRKFLDKLSVYSRPREEP